MKKIGKIEHGFNLASESFTLCWNNKKLLLYSLIPLAIDAPIRIILKILYPNIPVYSIAPIKYLPMFKLSFGTELFILFISFSFMYWAYTALAKHVIDILKQKPSSITMNLEETNESFYPLGILVVIEIIILNLYGLLWPFFIPVSIIWHFITFFILPIIAAGEKNISQILTTSLTVLKKYFLTIVSGYLWIVIMAFCAFITFAAPLLILSAFIKPFSSIVFYIAVPLLFILQILFTTTSYTFSTLIYKKYQEEQAHE